MSDQNEPAVYRAVRAVGTLRPKFQPGNMGTSGKVFADQLDVRGTAFWLKDYHVLITCAHVVQDLVVLPIEISGLLVIGNRGNYLRASVGAVDYDHDLAILRLPPDTSKEIIQIEEKDGLTITQQYPNVGDSVSYAGFPLGIQLLNSTHAPTYAEGVIGAQLGNHPLRKEIQISGAVVGGFSGSPITLKGDPSTVIGVVSNSPSQAAGQASIFMAISWEHVKAIAELSR